MKVEILKLLNSMNLETLVFFSGKKERKKERKQSLHFSGCHLISNLFSIDFVFSLSLCSLIVKSWKCRTLALEGIEI
jgi:hypothetical protein